MWTLTFTWNAEILELPQEHSSALRTVNGCHYLVEYLEQELLTNHSFNKYLLSAFCKPGILLGIRNIMGLFICLLTMSQVLCWVLKSHRKSLLCIILLSVSQNLSIYILIINGFPPCWSLGMSKNCLILKYLFVKPWADYVNFFFNLAVISGFLRCYLFQSLPILLLLMKYLYWFLGFRISEWLSQLLELTNATSWHID